MPLDYHKICSFANSPNPLWGIVGAGGRFRLIKQTWASFPGPPLNHGHGSNSLRKISNQKKSTSGVKDTLNSNRAFCDAGNAHNRIPRPI